MQEETSEACLLSFYESENNKCYYLEGISSFSTCKRLSNTREKFKNAIVSNQFFTLRTLQVSVVIF